MNQKIVYVNDDGGISVITPTPECLEKHTINEIAKKDVPFGKPYKIVDVSEIPQDRTFRNAWAIDESILTDGVGAEFNVFEEKPKTNEVQQ